MNSTAIHLSVLASVLGLAACSKPAVPAVPAATGIVVRVDPATATLPPGGTASFASSVTGTVDTRVDWSVAEGSAGGSVSADGTYTAPAVEGVYHLVAASHADPSRQQVASVSVSPSASAAPAPGAGIRIDPSSVTLDACKGQVFAASVSGLADGSVTWAVAEPGGGTVTNGVYVAPAAPGTYHVVATSVADPSRVAQAIVTIGPERLETVAIAPGSGTVSPAGSLALSATVTTSCGTFPAAGP